MSDLHIVESAADADSHRLARGAAANAAVLIAANFRGVFTFLIARILGEAGLGRFSLVFATVDLLTKVATVGLDTSIIPLVARTEAAGQRDQSRRLFVRSVVLCLVASTALVVIGIPFVAWFAEKRHLDEFTRGGTIMLLALPGIAVARVSTGVSRGLLAMRSEFFSRGLVETWVTTGVFIVAVSLGLRDVAPSLAVVCGSFGGALVAFVLTAQTIELGRHHAAHARTGRDEGRSLAGYGEMIRFSLPVAASGLLNSLALRVDVLLLGAFVGRAPGVTIESFGVFCAAAEVAGGLRKVRQVFDPIFAPVAAARHVASERMALKETVAGPGRWVLAGQLPIVGALMLASGSVLSIYGPGFRAGAAWLAILALAHAANSFAGLVETLLMIERPSLNFANATATVGVQAIAGLLLIPKFGVMGAVVAMGAGFTAQGVLRFIELKHVFGWAWPWRSLLRPLAAFAIAFTPAAILRVLGGEHVEIASGLLFLASYVAAWYRLGADPADRLVWRRLLKRG
jgi:O-antigen/teichoic acid export membrane protein